MGIYFVTTGYAYFKHIFGYFSAKNRFNCYLTKAITTFNTRSEGIIYISLLVLSFICLLTVVYTFYTIGYLPQKALFSIEGVLSSEIRNEVGREFEGNSIVRNVFAITLTPILSYVWYAYYKGFGGRNNKLLFYTFLILSLFILTYNLAKAPLILYLIGFVFLRIYIGGTVNFKFLLLAFCSMFILLIFSYYLTFDSFDILHLLSPNTGIGGRIFLGQSMGVFFSFDIFPAVKEHLHFSSLSRFISSILGVEYNERSSRILMEVLNPSGVKNGTAGVLNSLFIGEAWANFGLLGVIFSPIIIGFYIQSIFNFFITSTKCPLYIGLFAYFSYRLPVVGSFNEFFYNPLQIIVFSIFFIIIALSTKLNRN